MVFRALVAAVSLVIATPVLLKPAVISPALAVTSEDPNPYEGRVAYEILRGDTSLGWHRIMFERKGEDLIVNIAIDLEFGFGFVKLYDYTHRNRETWRNGQLVKIETRTDDNGDAWIVEAALTEEGFMIFEGVDAGKIVEPPVFPTSYWDRRFVQQSSVLGTQKGYMRDIEVSDTAQTYAIRGDLYLDLPYDAEGRWQGGVATTGDGEIIWRPGVPPSDDERDWWSYSLDDLSLEELREGAQASFAEQSNTQ